MVPRTSWPDFAETAQEAGIDWRMEFNDCPGCDPSGYSLSGDVNVKFYSNGKIYAQGDMQAYAASWASGDPLMFPSAPVFG